MLTQPITQTFLRQLEKIQRGRLTLHTPDGRTREFAGADDGVHADLQINDWSVIRRFALKGDIGFAECHQEGLLESRDLTSLILLSLENAHVLDRYVYGQKIMAFLQRCFNRLRANTQRGSKRNIHAHYDLGNHFYSLWLDPSMTYSSAIFANSDDTLINAQRNKYERIISKLSATQGDLLEIGCGWGGFLDHAARHDYNMKGITISSEQLEYAKARLGARANIAYEDYRKQEGMFDHIVSIEMFEAVGEQYWPTYFQTIQKLLRKNGRAVVQTITIDDGYFERYRKTSDIFRAFIFPGGMLPSFERFSAEAARAGLRIIDTHRFGHDYARTIEHWLHAFERNLGTIRSMNFDEPFIRLWRFYLSACIAGFRVGRTNVMQVALTHA